VAASGGSLANLAGLRNQEYTVALAQSDLQHHAFKGTGPFRDRGSHQELRSLFSAHAELLIVLVRNESGIKAVGDLKGKRLNVGPAGTAQRQLFERMMAEYRWAMRDFAVAAELRQQHEADILCKARVDAVIHVSSHPASEVKEAAEECDVAAVPIVGAEIDRLVSESGYYVKSVIPGGLYRGSAKDVPSIGTVSTIVATTGLDAESAYEIVRAVFDNISRLKRSHPALARLDAKRMATDGLSAPLHEGAAKFFREKGWIK
jgi:TRAP transporter TAXI family solute receptor